jgi:hypothetical protein
MLWFFCLENARKSFLNLGNIVFPHNSIKNNKVHVDQLTKEMAECTRVAREKVIDLQNVTNENLNKKISRRMIKCSC